MFRVATMLASSWPSSGWIAGVSLRDLKFQQENHWFLAQSSLFKFQVVLLIIIAMSETLKMHWIKKPRECIHMWGGDCLRFCGVLMFEVKGKNEFIILWFLIYWLGQLVMWLTCKQEQGKNGQAKALSGSFLSFSNFFPPIFFQFLQHNETANSQQTANNIIIVI